MARVAFFFFFFSFLSADPHQTAEREMTTRATIVLNQNSQESGTDWRRVKATPA